MFIPGCLLRLLKVLELFPQIGQMLTTINSKRILDDVATAVVVIFNLCAMWTVN